MVEAPIILRDFIPNKMEQIKSSAPDYLDNLPNRAEFVTRGFKSERQRIQVHYIYIYIYNTRNRK